MATDIAFVGELGGKRVRGSAGRTIRLIRLFEVSTRFLFMRRLIFPCVLDSRGCFAGHIRSGDVEFRLARNFEVLHQAFANSVSGPFGVVSARVLAGRAYSSDPLSSHFSLVVTLFSKGRWSHSFCRRPSYVIAGASVL